MAIETSISFPVPIAMSTHDPNFPEVRESKTRHRVLTVHQGMLEVNFDSVIEPKTWAEIESLAISRRHHLRASRTVGDQAIAAFLLGNIATAKKSVVTAWMAAETASPFESNLPVPANQPAQSVFPLLFDRGISHNSKGRVTPQEYLSWPIMSYRRGFGTDICFVSGIQAEFVTPPSPMPRMIRSQNEAPMLLSNVPVITLISLPVAFLAACSSATYSTSSGLGQGNSPNNPIQTTSSPSPYWTAPEIGSIDALGTLNVPLSTGTTVSALNPTITPVSGSLVCIGTSWNSAGTSATITYTNGITTVHVVVQIATTNVGISVQLDADQPVISSANMGNWTSNLAAQAIGVPYYTGNIWYAPGIASFVNGWWDWHTTQATQLNGTAAVYLAKTNGSLNTLHELMEVALSPIVDAVLPSPGNAPSPYRTTMQGRTVLDIWDSGFSAIKQGLADLGDYGIGNCIGIIHDWQHEGYDNALPEHYSANPSLGGDAGIEAAINQGISNGCLMAVHENYVDYYPNYPGFNAASIALGSDGSRMLSWLNPTTGIQSFSTKPSWMITNAQAQSPVIHSSYGTTAGFIDVNSSAAISSHGDMDSTVTGAGTLAAWMSSSTALWAYERQTHDGPILGEGSGHWYYSGLLDGVEAQTGAGSTPMNSDAALPLFVDFDLVQIHPLQVNHGMGYYSRWTQAQTSSMSTTQSDAYRMQEVAFGHAPFLSNGTWSNVPLAFTEANLVSPVAASYGVAQASSIQYQLNGSWVSSSLAAQAGQFSTVQIAYSNGLTVVANSSTTPLSWNGLTIPQFGWAAKSANLLAYTAQCGTAICDYAQTPTSIFANARNQSDGESGWGYAAPAVASVNHASANSFAITYNWQIYRSLGTQLNYTVFVHFVNDSQVSNSNAGIVFQGDHQPSPATSQWQIGTTVLDGPQIVYIPSSVPDGTYSIRMGLYDPATGDRLLLSGNNDGTGRYIVGYLTLNAGGTQVTFTPPPAPANDPRLNASGSIVGFNTVQTDGMISITQQNGQWVLRPFPRYRNFTVLLNSASFLIPRLVQASGGTNTTAVPISQGNYWQIPLNGSKTYSWPIN